ncbi:MAG: redoxin domain-containing protein [Gemmataceae bacterium]|nr:redoxin domain-containing protein [Gemmataceae bacterium]
MRAALAVLCLAVLAEAHAQPPKPAVGIKTIAYADLGKLVRENKGKVVVVDVWASWCVPCKKEFPHLVELHKKHAADGLVCVSLSVDKPDKEKAALDFLVKQEATFANFRLEESFKWLMDKLDAGSIPVVVVFDRDNKRAAKFTKDFDYEKDVTPLVLKLLKDKPGK